MTHPHTSENLPESASITLSVVAVATMLCLIVFTVPITTIGAIASSFSADPGIQAWVMSGMPVGAATELLGFGALGDNLGRRKIFLTGLLITALSSVAAAAAPDAIFLIIARIFQGIGSAAILACGLGLIGQVFIDHTARARAAGIWAAGLGAGVAVGPIAAAVLLPIGGWRASHWLIAVCCTALLIFGMKSIPRDESTKRGRIDIVGIIVFAAAVVCFLSALTETRIGFSPLIALLFALSVVLTALFVRIERRATNPVLQLDLFRRRDFVGATLGAFASGAGVLAIMTLIPLVLQQSTGVSPFAAALILTAWSATTSLTALASKYLPRSWSPRALMLASMAGCVAGQLALMVLGTNGSSLVILPGLVLAGLSNGVLNAALGHQAVQTVPSDRTAMGSAANNTARYLGSAIGITIAAVIVTHGTSTDPVQLIENWRVAVLVSVAFTLVGLGATFVAGGRR